MNRAAMDSLRAKRDLVFIDDADEPPVKKEAEEPDPSESPVVVELRQQLKRSEENFQKLCEVASRDKEALRARIEYLESFVDSKEGILTNASVEDELKKNLAEVSRELEEERQRSAEQHWKLAHLEPLKRRVGELTSQLVEERNRSALLQLKVNQVDAILRPVVQPAAMPDLNLGTVTGSLGSQPLGRLTAVIPSPARKQHQLQPTVQSNQSTKPDVLTPVMVRVQMEKANLNKTTNKKQIDIAEKQEFRETLRSEYSGKTIILFSNHPCDGAPAVIHRLRNTPRIESRVVKNRTQGVFATQDIYPGGYIAELCGFVCLQSECFNRDFSPAPWLNDRTFPVEKAGEKLIIDARKMGNSARFVRRSCKPNAELKVLMFTSGLHVMIKAKEGVELKAMEEVSIQFDHDWMRHPRPAQGCTCKGDELKTCEIELFFGKAFQGAQVRAVAASKDN